MQVGLFDDDNVTCEYYLCHQVDYLLTSCPQCNKHFCQAHVAIKDHRCECIIVEKTVTVAASANSLLSSDDNSVKKSLCVSDPINSRIPAPVLLTQPSNHSVSSKFSLIGPFASLSPLSLVNTPETAFYPAMGGFSEKKNPQGSVYPCLLEEKSHLNYNKKFSKGSLLLLIFWEHAWNVPPFFLTCPNTWIVGKSIDLAVRVAPSAEKKLAEQRWHAWLLSYAIPGQYLPSDHVSNLGGAMKLPLPLALSTPWNYFGILDYGVVFISSSSDLPSDVITSVRRNQEEYNFSRNNSWVDRWFKCRSKHDENEKVLCLLQ